MKKTELKEFDNTSYQPGSMAKRSLWYVVNVLFFNTSVPFPNSLKRMLLRIFGAKIGKGVILKPKVNIKYPWMLGVGNHSWIGEGVWIDNLGHVEIGANCCLSQGVMLLCGNHNFSVSSFDLIVEDIKLEDGVFMYKSKKLKKYVEFKEKSLSSVYMEITRDGTRGMNKLDYILPDEIIAC